MNTVYRDKRCIILLYYLLLPDPQGLWELIMDRLMKYQQHSAPTLLWMKVMPSRWPASCPTGCGLTSRSVRLSHTLHSASSLPE